MPLNGLTEAQVKKSREQNGSNALTEAKAEPFWKKLAGNFGDPLIKILIIALLINVIIMLLGGIGVIETEIEWYEPVGIGVAVLIAAFVSAFSEHRSENAFKKLQEDASRILCKVYRNGGNMTEIPIGEIVAGDLILLQTGDKIPADGVIISGELKADQSALNGESAEAEKKAPAGGKNIKEKTADVTSPHAVFRGTVVRAGSAVMKAVSVGDKTVYGQIASELQHETDRDTPLKVKLKKLAGSVSKFGYGGGAAIAVALLLSRIIGAGFADYFSAGFAPVFVKDILDAVVLAVIIIVMAVPEGLPLMIALVSAQNMGKMLRDNVLVRTISGIETAGSLNILYSDKTGTITRGKLEVVNFTDGAGKEVYTCSEVGGKLGKLLTMAITENTDAVVNDGKIMGGNATERAVLAFAKGNSNTTALKKISVIPFNSAVKFSAATVSFSGRNITLIKGAPEKILQKCGHYFTQSGNKISMADNTAVADKIERLADRAIRVLAVAVSDAPIKDGALPDGEWTLIGILGLRDEIRPEAVTAVKEVHAAGIQTVMITGDRLDTAESIARECGILSKPDELAITSEQLAEMSDSQLKKALPNIRVIARALPTDKSRLVRVSQELGLVAGMTGDGVNDSPALKKADVGFAMGGGTEVAKEAADIVILDDNFSSIQKAVLYGRTIYSSIRKFIIFQLTINFSAVAVSFICPLLGLRNPLTITQILWLNLVMDTLAALAFGGEPTRAEYMREKPKDRAEPIVSAYMRRAMFTAAVYTVFVSLVFLLAPPITALFPDESALTGYFALFVFTALFNAFNARTDKVNLFENIKSNMGFLRIIGFITVMQAGLIYLGGSVMDCYGLNFKQWIVVLALAFPIILVDTARKIVSGGRKIEQS